MGTFNVAQEEHPDLQAEVQRLKMDCSCITIPLSTTMDRIERKLISHGAATFGSYVRRVARLARFEAQRDKLNKQKKKLEKARQRAIKEVKDRQDMVVAAHTLCSLKTDCTLFINLPLVADYE
jgi:adenylate kinase